MRLLLDTNALFWWFIDEARMSPAAHNAIKAKDNEVYVSIASVWEMAIKVGIGKWPEARALLTDFEGLTRAEDFRVLPITVAHVRDAGLVRAPHRDPFDRLLAAQSMLEGLTIVTPDAALRSLGAPACGDAPEAAVIARWERTATDILAFEGGHVEWPEGNFADYEEDKKRRLGDAAVEPHRIKFERR